MDSAFACIHTMQKFIAVSSRATERLVILSRTVYFQFHPSPKLFAMQTEKTTEIITTGQMKY